MDLKNYELAEQDYMGGMKYKDIAAKYGVTLNTVKSWKTRYKWDKKGVHTKKRKVRTQKIEKQEAAETVEQVLENGDLNDKQRLFCLYYSKTFNATKSYQKAYGCTYESAMARSCLIMKDPRIKAEIMRLKQAKLNKAMLEPEDIFAKYMEIAFSDMTDFVSFGREKGRNTVRFRESDQVDGTLISEVSQGKDGAKIKLADRMKALDWLAGHMDLATEEQAARVEKLQAETARIRGDDPDEQAGDDGFVDALKAEVNELWEDE